jgi:hypothetical protein
VYPLGVQDGAQQVLSVAIRFEGKWCSREKFFVRMGKDGRITIPKLTCNLLRAYWEQDITGATVEVEVSPSDRALVTEDE